MIKKLLASVAAFMLALALLSGCGDTPAVTQILDYGDFGEYYSELAYEVRNGDGLVTEQMYFLCSDPELVEAVGKKDVYFDAETGEMNRYTVTIGVLKIEQVVSYTSGNGTSFYSEMYYDENEHLTRGTWDNNYFDEEGTALRDTGEQTYYSDGRTVKVFRLEQYRAGELVSTTTREYDEDGNMTSEVIE